MRAISTLLLLSLFLPGPCDGQKRGAMNDLSSQINVARHSVVAIAIKVMDWNPLPPVCPWTENQMCIVGTGSIVDNKGTVVTAWHVANDARKLAQNFEQAHRMVLSVIMFEIPNFDGQLGSVKVENTANFNAVAYKILAEDKAHDLALLHPEVKDPFESMAGAPLVANDNQTTERAKPTPATLLTTRPVDGLEVFTCGYPFGQKALTTTSGFVATAWGQENLVVAGQNGISGVTNVYRLDVRANPGNSGGPVFERKAGAIIGIIVEIAQSGGGGLAIAVPSSYVADLMKANDLIWSTPNSPPNKKGKS